MPNGRKMQSTHMCNITIPGLPTIITGHILPHLTVALLVGVRPLCKAGCQVLFSNNYCDVIFNGNVILRGHKDPSTDLCTLPINRCNTMQTTLPQSAPGIDCAPHYMHPEIYPGITPASLTQSVPTRANGVKFAHQLLRNPKTSMLLKAMCKGFLRGCPNLSK
jgi:hypothetical protein